MTHGFRCRDCGRAYSLSGTPKSVAAQDEIIDSLLSAFEDEQTPEKEEDTKMGKTLSAEDFSEEELKAARGYVENMYELGEQLYRGTDSIVLVIADDIRKLSELKRLAGRLLDEIDEQSTSADVSDDMAKLRTLIDELQIPGQD
jgi:hypothetical protein